MRLTENFKLKEFFVSREYPNIAEYSYRQMTKGTRHSLKSAKVQDSLFLLCHLILQPVRDMFNLPVQILSGYRSRDLNKKVGGSVNSRHMLGKAADFTVKDKLPAIFDWVKEGLKGRYGELLLYQHKDGSPNFIHVALPRLGAGVKIKVIK